MTTNCQVLLVGLSACVIFIAISLAFSPLAQILSRRIRLGLRFLSTVSALSLEYTGLPRLWRAVTPNEESIQDLGTRLSSQLYWKQNRKRIEEERRVRSGPAQGEDRPMDDRGGIARAKTWWEGSGAPSPPKGNGRRRASTAGFSKWSRTKTTATGAAFSQV